MGGKAGEATTMGEGERERERAGVRRLEKVNKQTEERCGRVWSGSEDTTAVLKEEEKNLTVCLWVENYN